MTREVIFSASVYSSNPLMMLPIRNLRPSWKPLKRRWPNWMNGHQAFGSVMLPDGEVPRRIVDSRSTAVGQTSGAAREAAECTDSKKYIDVLLRPLPLSSRRDWHALGRIAQ